MDAMSASAPALPTLSNEDYHVPKHGVGLTGHPKKVLLGTVAKDSGQYSSRINQIIKQADKVPGPGKYMSHKDWLLNGGNLFMKTERTYKPCNKTPAPVTYESKNIMMELSNASKSNLSHRPRIIHGKVPTGKRRSFLDQAERHGRAVPGPGGHDPIPHTNTRMDTHIVKTLDWQKLQIKTKSRGSSKDPNLGPDHYKPEWRPTEEALPNYSVPKSRPNNFLDKAVKEKWCDVHTKKEIPGPGTYETHNFDSYKVSRGTKYLQLRGMSRSAVSGYF